MGRADPRLLSLIGQWLAAREPLAPPPVLGVAGSQGSGKSTLARELADTFGGVTFSLDDVYLGRAERQALAAQLHPLFETRGPPGTHDLALLTDTLDRLQSAMPGDETALPAFDKLADDRRPRSDWPVFHGRPALIVLEGWMLGAVPQEVAALEAPVNELERTRDPHGVWRRHANAELARRYLTVWQRLDRWIFLQAPSFDVVLDWRAEQEAGLRGAEALTPEGYRALALFVEHYERLTRHMLEAEMGEDLRVLLDRERRVLALTGSLME